MAVPYRIYEGLPDHAAMAGEEGGSVSLYEVMRRAADQPWGGGNVALALNAIRRSMRDRHRTNEREIEEALLPTLVMLVDFCTQQVLDDYRIQSRWRYCMSPSYQADLGRIIRRYYPNVTSRPIRQEDLRGVQPE